LLPGVSEDRAVAIAERIRKNVFETDMTLAGIARRVSAIVGGVTFDEDRNVSELLHRAGEGPYAAKRIGRSRVVMPSLLPDQTMNVQ
jgi:diguanylate cyclase